MNPICEYKMIDVEIPEEIWVKNGSESDDRIMSCDD